MSRDLQPNPAWWERALVEFSASAAIQLRKNFPAIKRVHDDLVGEAVLALTALLQKDVSELPPAWYLPATPDAADSARFFGLANSVLDRRIKDHFRSSYKGWMQSVEDLDEHQQPAADSAPLDVALDTLRAARTLLGIIDRLPARDRDLLRDIATGNQPSPMNDGDRQRLRRLRIELQQKLTARLGADAMELIQRI